MKKNHKKWHRAETGLVQFGEDWPGVFIRGDNAMYISMLLTSILEKPELLKTEYFKSQFKGFISLLQNSNINQADEEAIQKLKDYKNCIK